jgi:hypothetical protein
MTTMSRSGFAHRAHPRARRRQLYDKRCAGRAGPPMDKPSPTVGIDPDVKITS